MIALCSKFVLVFQSIYITINCYNKIFWHFIKMERTILPLQLDIATQWFDVMEQKEGQEY